MTKHCPKCHGPAHQMGLTWNVAHIKRPKNCPRCKKALPAHGLRGVALTRRDSETYICSSCGQTEALEDVGMAEAYTGKPYWKIALTHQTQGGSR